MHEEVTDEVIRQCEYLAARAVPMPVISEKVGISEEEVEHILEGGVYENVLSVE